MPEILFPAPVDRAPEVAVFLQQGDNVMRRKLYGSIEALVFQIWNYFVERLESADIQFLPPLLRASERHISIDFLISGKFDER